MNWSELTETFDGCKVDGDKVVITSKLHEIIEFVKKNYSFDILKEIIGTHMDDDMIELIYHLYSTENDEDLKLSINLKGEAESIADLYESAKNDENEIFDLLGVNFLGHDDLKRLYMPENWEGHPLRKDYV